ncbi:MAG: rhodanese-like domain-containing protein [Vitreoscilla sp.]
MASRLISIDQLAAALGSEHPPTLLDVRDLIESERGHIPGAAILPRRRIEFRIEALVRDRATPLIVVDSGDDIDDGQRDPRAALAAATLSALGYRDVCALEGGVAGWRRAGLPVVSGTQVSSKAFGRRIGDLERVASVDVETLKRWFEQGRRVALCDVRSAAEHTEGCIPGAVSLPGFEIVSHALDMTAESDVIVLCSCARTRSMIVARTLIDLGLADVLVLDGGTLAWQLAGHELEQGSRRRRVAPSRPARQFAQLGSARLAKHFGVERIEAAELAALLYATSGNFCAFDLRHHTSHVVAHVPRSVSVRSDLLIVRHEESIAVRDAPVVLIDDDGVRALLTGVWLRRLGLPRVQKLAGGYASWVSNGRPASSVAELPLGWAEASAVTPGLGVDDVSRWLAAYAPAHVLHVDTSSSYRRGHLPGATWLPRGWLEPRIARVAPSQHEALLLTCSDGAQSAYAAATLRRSGYAHVAWLQGGTRLWAASGRALESAALPTQDDELLPPARRDPEAMRDYLDWERRG